MISWPCLPWHLNVTLLPCVTSWLWGCKSKLGGLPRASTRLSLIILVVSLLDSVTAGTTFLPEDLILSGSFFCITCSVTLVLDSKLLFLACWLLMVMEVDDLCWLAGSLPSFDSVEVCGADVTVLLQTSGLVPGLSLAVVVVLAAVWVSVIELRVDVLADFWPSIRPLLLCSTAVVAAIFGRSLLEDLLLFGEK